MSTICANPECGKRDIPLRACSRCKTVKYCSVECQRAHWSLHKSPCRKDQQRAESPRSRSECSEDLDKEEEARAIRLLGEAIAGLKGPMSWDKRCEVQEALVPEHLHSIGLRSERVAALMSEYVRLTYEQWGDFLAGKPMYMSDFCG